MGGVHNDAEVGSVGLLDDCPCARDVADGGPGKAHELERDADAKLCRSVGHFPQRGDGVACDLRVCATFGRAGHDQHPRALDHLSVAAQLAAACDRTRRADRAIHSDPVNCVDSPRRHAGLAQHPMHIVE